MISTFKHKKLNWIDLENPTNEEVKQIMHKYSIHPLVANELLKPTFRAKVDIFEEFIYLVIHFPIFDNTTRSYGDCEIDFIVGKNFLITTHYQTIPSLYEMTKIFEADAMLGERYLTKNTGILMFYIVRQLYDFSLKQLDTVQVKISDIEQKMFDKGRGAQYDLVRKISHTRRDILDFRRIIHPHKEVFVSLEHACESFFKDGFDHYLSNIIGEYYKIWNIAGGYRETIESLQETVDSLLSHRSNEIMKTFTIVAFLTFPLMLFAGLFSMDTKFTPIVGMPGDFWIVIGVMAMATSVMFFYFKSKKWL